MTALLPLYRLFLRRQITKGRLFLFAAFGALGMLVAFAINRNAGDEAVEATVVLIYLFGFGLMIPIIALVQASSAFGELVEDETLVYLWHRPVPRWILSAAAMLGTATVVLPFSVISMVAMAVVGTGGDGDAIVAAAVSSALAAVAYSGMFVLLGLVFRLALIWGLVYLLVWELAVSRFGDGAARLSINTYPSSVLSRMTDIELPLAERAMATGVGVPLLVGILGVALSAWKLNRMDVA